MNALVAGVAGFIGSFLCKRLLEEADNAIITNRYNSELCDVLSKVYTGDIWKRG